MSISVYNYLGWGFVVNNISSYDSTIKIPNPKQKDCCSYGWDNQPFCPHCGTQKQVKQKVNPILEWIEEIEEDYKNFTVCYNNMKETIVVYSHIGLKQSKDIMYRVNSPILSVDQSTETQATEELQKLLDRVAAVEQYPIQLISFVSC